MTVTATNRKNQFSTNGVTTEFTFDFAITDVSQVYALTVDDDGTETVFENFTAVKSDVIEGGTLTTNEVLSGVDLLIYRDTALTQQVDYESGGKFPADSHEQALDKLTLQNQDQQEELDRTLKSSISNDDPYTVGKLESGFMLASVGSEIVSTSITEGDLEIAKGNEITMIARSLNALDTQVIYSTDTTTVLDDVLYIYDASEQITYAKPSDVGIGEVIVSVASGLLTTDSGNYNLLSVNLAPVHYTYNTTLEAKSSKENFVVGDSISIKDRHTATFYVKESLVANDLNVLQLYNGMFAELDESGELFLNYYGVDSTGATAVDDALELAMIAGGITKEPIKHLPGDYKATKNCSHLTALMGTSDWDWQTVTYILDNSVAFTFLSPVGSTVSQDSKAPSTYGIEFDSVQTRLHTVFTGYYYRQGWFNVTIRNMAKGGDISGVYFTTRDCSIQDNDVGINPIPLSTNTGTRVPSTMFRHYDTVFLGNRIGWHHTIETSGANNNLRNVLFSGCGFEQNSEYGARTEGRVVPATFLNSWGEANGIAGISGNFAATLINYVPEFDEVDLPPSTRDVITLSGGRADINELRSQVSGDDLVSQNPSIQTLIKGDGTLTGSTLDGVTTSYDAVNEWYTINYPYTLLQPIFNMQGIENGTAISSNAIVKMYNADSATEPNSSGRVKSCFFWFVNDAGVKVTPAWISVNAIINKFA